MDFQNHLHELEMWDETPWREWLRDFRRSSSKIRSGRIERFVNELQNRLLFTSENVEIMLAYVEGEITAEEHDRPSKDLTRAAIVVLIVFAWFVEPWYGTVATSEEVIDVIWYDIHYIAIGLAFLFFATRLFFPFVDRKWLRLRRLRRRLYAVKLIFERASDKRTTRVEAAATQRIEITPAA